MAWFNPNEHDASGAFGGSAMPIGKFPVVITASRVEAANSNSNSGKLVLSLMVLDGPHKDHKGDWNLNLFNENEQARQIAGRQLAAVCSVTNTQQLDGKPEGVELWNKPFIIEFRKQPKDEKYTECCGVWDVSGQPPSGQRAAAPSQSAPPQQFAAQPSPQPSGQKFGADQPAWAQPGQAPAAQPAAPAWSAPTQATPAQSAQQAPAWAAQPPQGGPAPWGAR